MPYKIKKDTFNIAHSRRKQKTIIPKSQIKKVFKNIQFKY